MKTERKPPAWIRKARRRARKWILADTGLSASEWDALSYPKLLKLPIIKTLHLNPSGGITRFPGSDLQDVTFVFRCLKRCKHAGGYLKVGETYHGLGETLEDAVRSAIQLVVELASLRGEREEIK